MISADAKFSPGFLRLRGVFSAESPQLAIDNLSRRRSDSRAADGRSVVYRVPDRVRPRAEQLKRGFVSVSTTQLGAPLAPDRAVTVAELTRRIESDAQTTLMHVVGPQPDALSVEQLLRREGRWGMVPRTRHAADPTPSGDPQHDVTPVRNSTPLVAPPPLHSTAQGGARQRVPARNSRPVGFGPRAAGSSAPRDRRSSPS